ncbi:50S ribosomal protein L9 [Thermobispora bispora]|jgi:large subunit ribosomal protein L9|uniref:Large ribosomal subunit protein bL9 n=1 Tax=Thermobispora bispora (strain ATCC 19993 / DSM 43833 / CBS 139.67 / JCM 10125 / KCTC 9307 / NBRC 14880 / R51) TaxID=469371 RepID=D6YAJ3_THEBD|nr:50S ribosomal protein L9 [Thermobispora bispora]ADG90246.1 ribosomal protein L9 [Thermobispora bispora DSM 43833]MBO2473303.1 50S ribosomal protein L9 [Actinomycetales bacterium]MBX6166984.1 50S ribosomal protein L9 [Thermobispora bispora]MDI9579202.1 50S ribosomal protein L9 [Thermobispora sp.]
MKLILTSEVSGLGAPGDVVEVKDGYGRNYLLPRGLAIRWSKGAQSQIDAIKRARELRSIRDREAAEEIAQQLGSLKVQLRTRAGESGRLFGSVTTGDIAEAVKAAGGPELDRRRIMIENPIKSLGTHRVTVRLHPEVSASLDIEVVAA